VTFNPKTRSPPISPGKDILRHLLQKLWCCHNCILELWLLKDSSQKEPVGDCIDSLQWRIKFFFFSKTKSFLCNQIEQQVTAAPRRNKDLKCFVTPFSYLLNICATLWGFVRLKAIWGKLQINRAKRQSKNKCWIISSSWQKQQVLLPCQLRLIKLSFLNTIPLLRYHIKIFSLRGAFSFHNRLLKFGTGFCFVMRFHQELPIRMQRLVEFVMTL
jgi:hypothetical protein